MRLRAYGVTSRRGWQVLASAARRQSAARPGHQEIRDWVAEALPAGLPDPGRPASPAGRRLPAGAGHRSRFALPLLQEARRMPWLVTQTLEALNLEHVHRLYAEKAKVKAVLAGFPVNVAVDLAPDAAERVVRDIVDQIVQGHSVEVVGEEVRRLTPLR